MSDYKQTRDAAGNITSQYGQMLRNLDDDLAVIGVDGIRRSFDEHYDTIREVEQDPTGAMWAIHKQADRIGELEAKLAKAMNIAEVLSGCVEYDYHGNVCGEEEAKAIAALAELKGQDDE